MNNKLLTAAALLLAGLLVASAQARTALAEGTEKAAFIGSAACKDCHEENYNSFVKYSKKARSRASVEQMLPKLTEAEKNTCFQCHTTGYGQSNGFVSYEKTPQLADVGCETCHNAGSLHAESGDPALIKRKPDIKQCESCHSAERCQTFSFKPLMYSGAH